MQVQEVVGAGACAVAECKACNTPCSITWSQHLHSCPEDWLTSPGAGVGAHQSVYLQV